MNKILISILNNEIEIIGEIVFLKGKERITIDWKMNESRIKEFWKWNI